MTFLRLLESTRHRRFLDKVLFCCASNNSRNHDKEYGTCGSSSPYLRCYAPRQYLQLLYFEIGLRQTPSLEGRRCPLFLSGLSFAAASCHTAQVIATSQPAGLIISFLFLGSCFSEVTSITKSPRHLHNTQNWAMKHGLGLLLAASGHCKSCRGRCRVRLQCHHQH
jgi:hypothetical protein